MRVTAPRVVAFWGSLLATLLLLCWVGHESWVDLSLWGFAVTVLWTTAALVFLANRRAPVHRGAYTWPTSAGPSLALALAAGLAAVAAVYPPWFAILVPVPLGVAAYAAIRDRKLRQRMLVAGAVDPKAPPHLARPGQPREIPPWPDGDGEGT